MVAKVSAIAIVYERWTGVAFNSTLQLELCPEWDAEGGCPHLIYGDESMPREHKSLEYPNPSGDAIKMFGIPGTPEWDNAPEWTERDWVANIEQEAVALFSAEISVEMEKPPVEEEAKVVLDLRTKARFVAEVAEVSEEPEPEPEPD